MVYERSNIRKMAGYTPGEQPQTADVVKLNTNENPYPPSDAVIATLRTFPAERLRRYPPPMADAFRRAAAEVHGVAVENIIATNGGDELLRMAVTTYVEPGASIAAAEPSYSLYPVLAEAHGSPMVRIALEGDWSLPRDFAQQVVKSGAQLAFVVNPHAPSGHLTGVDVLAGIAEELRGRAVLLVDEAYVDFADPRLKYDAVGLIKGFDNVLLLRSLSKGYSLAGLRFGYGMGAAELMRPMLEKTKDSYNVDGVAQALATAAMESRDAAAATWEAVRGQRERLTAELRRRSWQVPDSQSNFILAQPPENVPPARKLYESLKERRVFVRYFDQDRLRDRLRISIGTPQQIDTLLATLDEITRRCPPR